MKKIRFHRWQPGNRNRLRVRGAEERASHAERNRQLEFQQQRREVERHVAVEAANAHPRPARWLFIRTLVKGDVATGGRPVVPLSPASCEGGGTPRLTFGPVLLTH